MDTPSMLRTADDVLAFWFGHETRGWTIASDRFPLWFGHAPETDATIRDEFGPTVDAAGLGDLDAWQSTPRGTLALIILLDQFPRNIFRGTPGMYQHDEAALARALAAIDRGVDAELDPVERPFLYLPLEHAENLMLQERCVVLFEELRDEALAAGLPEELTRTHVSMLDYAYRHRDVVARFGRFPHRNAILGRESTPEEIAFLKEPGSSF